MTWFCNRLLCSDNITFDTIVSRPCPFYKIIGCRIPYGRHFYTEYGMFSLWFSELWLIVHWITMKTCHIPYENPAVRDSATSVIMCAPLPHLPSPTLQLTVPHTKSIVVPYNTWSHPGTLVYTPKFIVVPGINKIRHITK